MALFQITVDKFTFLSDRNPKVCTVKFQVLYPVTILGIMNPLSLEYMKNK